VEHVKTLERSNFLIFQNIFQGKVFREGRDKKERKNKFCQNTKLELSRFYVKGV
jgi:hypothetical protein